MAENASDTLIVNANNIPYLIEQILMDKVINEIDGVYNVKAFGNPHYYHDGSYPYHDDIIIDGGYDAFRRGGISDRIDVRINASENSVSIISWLRNYVNANNITYKLSDLHNEFDVHDLVDSHMYSFIKRVFAIPS